MKLEPGDLQDADLKEGMRVIYRMVRHLAATPRAWKRKAKHTTHAYHPFFKKRGSKVTTAILVGDKEEEQS